MYYTSDDSRIHGHLTSLGRAEADFQRQKAALFRPDGQQRYGAAEHAERLAALQATVDEAVGAAQEAADTIIGEQRTILAAFEEGDPLDHLSATEQSAAAARKAFVQEDSETLPPTDLRARCQSALAAGDKATQYLLARYVGHRVRTADQVARDGQKGDLSGQERQELGRLVEELLAKVRGAAGQQKAEQAKALLERAQELRKRSVAAHDLAHGSAVDRERERLLSTGLYGSGARR
jgi:hypothetical protein